MEMIPYTDGFNGFMCITMYLKVLFIQNVVVKKAFRPKPSETSFRPYRLCTHLWTIHKWLG